MNRDTQKDPDKYQKAWQVEKSQHLVTINADLLLKVVQRDQQSFLEWVRLSDCVFIGISLLLLPVWIYLGDKNLSSWTWYLTIPVLIWGAGFTVVYRLYHQRKPGKPEEPLLRCVERSLTQVEDQLWYQKNSFWWFVLPVGLSLLVDSAHSAWLEYRAGLEALFYQDAITFVFFLVLFYFLFFMNRKFACSKYEKRRLELSLLLNSLKNEEIGEHASTTPEKIACCPRKYGRWLLVMGSCLVSFIVIALASGVFDSRYDGTPQTSGPAGDTLANLVAELRQEKDLVGLAAMVLIHGQVEAAAAHGERMLGSSVPLEIGDRWHLGGITKSITATMVARLIESGHMQWTDTVGESFPNTAIHEDWKSVTLEQLLTDTAGAPANFPKKLWRKQIPLGPECTLARLEAVLNEITEKPSYPPGEKYTYSNVGYTIVGAMAEKATGKTWSDLVKQEVFDPLKLDGVGFGPPRSPDPSPIDPGLDQPRGHHSRLRGKVAVDDKADNTPIMGPSGMVHMTLIDLCHFAREHLIGEQGMGQLLSGETYKKLHTPRLSYYAYGWVKKEPSPEFPYTVYWHNGSNTLWYALVAFVPEMDLVVAVTANDGDFTQAQDAAWEIVRNSANPFHIEKNLQRPQDLPKESFPRKSPFAAIRWQQGEPEVKLADQWYALVTLDGLSATEIVAFSQKTYSDKWQKRFEEDLVELLVRMGHPPRDQVTLVVKSLTSQETLTFEDVAMTEANRRAIRNAAQSRKKPGS